MKRVIPMIQAAVLLISLTTVSIITPAAVSSKSNVSRSAVPRFSVCSKKTVKLWSRLPDQRRLIAHQILRLTQLGSLPPKLLGLTLSYVAPLPLAFELPINSMLVDRRQRGNDDGQGPRFSGVTPGVTGNRVHFLVDWHAGLVGSSPCQHVVMEVMKKGTVLPALRAMPLTVDEGVKPGAQKHTHFSIQGHYNEETDRPAWQTQKSLDVRITTDGKKIAWCVYNKRQNVVTYALLHAKTHALDDQAFGQLEASVAASLHKEAEESKEGGAQALEGILA